MRVERIEWDGRAAGELAGAIRAARPNAEEVGPAVAEIIREVADRGDEVVRELTRRLDGVEVTAGSIRADRELIKQASEAVPADVRASMELAAANIRTVAEAELAATFPVDVELSDGQRIRIVDPPVDAAGVYVPGGKAAYPSSVLMCCVPRVAGIGRIAVASPPGEDGKVDPGVLAACAVTGVDEVYAMGAPRRSPRSRLGPRASTGST